MSEFMNTFYDRSRNDAATTTQEPPEATDTNPTDVEQTDPVAPADDTPSTETAEEPADTDAEPTDAESIDDIEADDTADDEAGDSTEVVDEDAAPVTLVPVTVEPDAAQSEPVVAVEARPAAATRGTTTVADGVVSKVVNMVAGKADGVHSLDDEDSSVTVDADIVTIRIALVVEYGHAVKALAEQLRTDVVDAVEQFLGLDVAAVDIHVGDIHYPEAV